MIVDDGYKIGLLSIDFGAVHDVGLHDIQRILRLETASVNAIGFCRAIHQSVSFEQAVHADLWQVLSGRNDSIFTCQINEGVHRQTRFFLFQRNQCLRGFSVHFAADSSVTPSSGFECFNAVCSE